jgi:hypothetical protein
MFFEFSNIRILPIDYARHIRHASNKDQAYLVLCGCKIHRLHVHIVAHDVSSNTDLPADKLLEFGFLTV